MRPQKSDPALVACATAHVVGPSAVGARTTHRGDLDGLRALAVTLVVLFHSHVPVVPGGFVGVDVFFVLSGFLITRNLVAEAATAGRIDLVEFWLRRARLLLPAASLVISVTVLGQVALRSHYWLGSVVQEAFAASTYWTNELLASVTGGYFDGRIEQRALMHTWSLSVEEQFYVVWPLLLAALAPRGRRRTTTVVAGLCLLSFVMSLVLTDAGSPASYYSALSRGWQFGVGALLALSWREDRPRPRRLAPLAVAVIIVAAAFLGRGATYPGLWALAPTVATAGLILAEPGAATRLGRVLTHRGTQWLGRLSYSWYLWHWPVTFLGYSAVSEHVADTAWTRSALGFASLLPAWLSYRLVEQPLRSRRPRGRGAEFGLSVVAPMAVSLVVVAGVLAHHQRLASQPFRAEVLMAGRDHPAHLGACWTVAATMDSPQCRQGDLDADHRVLVIGDSHAAQWMPTFDRLGTQRDLRVHAYQLGNCPVLVEPDRVSNLAIVDSAGCGRFRAGVAELLDLLQPHLVVVALSEGNLDLVGPGTGPGAARLPGALEEWERGYRDFARMIETRGTELLVLHDVPRWGDHPLECLYDAGSAGTCRLRRDLVEGRLAPVREAERRGLAAAGHGAVFDPVPLLCDTEFCPATTPDGLVIYQDTDHLTGTFAASLASELGTVVDDLVPR